MEFLEQHNEIIVLSPFQVRRVRCRDSIACSGLCVSNEVEPRGVPHSEAAGSTSLTSLQVCSLDFSALLTKGRTNLPSQQLCKTFSPAPGIIRSFNSWRFDGYKTVPY